MQCPNQPRKTESRKSMTTPENQAERNKLGDAIDPRFGHLETGSKSLHVQARLSNLIAASDALRAARPTDAHRITLTAEERAEIAAIVEYAHDERACPSRTGYRDDTAKLIAIITRTTTPSDENATGDSDADLPTAADVRGIMAPSTPSGEWQEIGRLTAKEQKEVSSAREQITAGLTFHPSIVSRFIAIIDRITRATGSGE